MRSILLGSLFVFLTAPAVAETVIHTKTNSWKSVPITVDDSTHTYTVTKGYLLPEGDYYYTYSGYRCLNAKVENAGTEAVIYNDANPDGHAIYCYPE